MLYAAWEWTHLIGIKAWYWRLTYLLVLTALAYAAWLIPIVWILMSAVLLWIFIGIWLIQYPKGVEKWKSYPIIPGVIGIVIIFACWVALIAIRAGEDGAIDLFLLLLIVCSADTGAYFIGKAIGKNKLMPLLSPQKTKEGFYGGLVVALLAAILYGLILKPDIFLSPLYSFLIIATVLLSVVGDLFESMAKRIQGLKDSGKILPGHGGLLDRIDSLLAAAPLFALIVWLIG